MSEKGKYLYIKQKNILLTFFWRKKRKEVEGKNIKMKEF